MCQQYPKRKLKETERENIEREKARYEKNQVETGQETV